MSAFLAKLRKIIGDDSMSIALFGLFLASLVAQSLSGWLAYNGALQAAHFQALGFAVYLSTGNFLDGMLSNWEAAILQLTVLIAFSSVLRQEGAAHSRKKTTTSHRALGWKLGSRATLREFLYANSLSLAFLVMFLVTFGLHLWFGEWKYNEDQRLRHLPPVSLISYGGSSSFWFSVFQCWEAEFAAIGIYIVLTIFLRQENSSESKPVGARNSQTGGTNE